MTGHGLFQYIIHVLCRDKCVLEILCSDHAIIQGTLLELKDTLCYVKIPKQRHDT